MTRPLAANNPSHVEPQQPTVHFALPGILPWTCIGSVQNDCLGVAQQQDMNHGRGASGPCGAEAGLAADERDDGIYSERRRGAHACVRA